LFLGLEKFFSAIWGHLKARCSLSESTSKLQKSFHNFEASKLQGFSKTFLSILKALNLKQIKTSKTSAAA
jgi:hypothetical protein